MHLIETCSSTVRRRLATIAAHQWRRALPAGLFALVVVGCGGGAGGGAGVAPAAPPPPPPPAVSAFQTWCQNAIGVAHPIRAGVTAQITTAEFTPAGNSGFEVCKQSGDLSRPGTARVAGFEVVVPSHWGGRLLFRGGGGFDGVISPFTYSPLVIEHGFATTATDMGHQFQTGDASEWDWAMNDPDAVEDFAFAAIPDVRAAAVAILCSHFNGACPPERVYFEGCSNGGRSALLAAQRAPDLFDGVIARAPVLQWPGLAVASNRFEKRIAAQSLSDTKLAAVDAAQFAACDALDGIADGVIGRPFDCPFDPDTLRCAQGDAPDCLTDAELETLATVRSPTALPFAQRDGLIEHPAFPLAPIGHLLTWPLWLQPSAQFPVPSLFAAQESFFRYLVAKDPSLDTLTIDPADYATELEALSTQLDATTTDFTAFASRGGKLILWHGAIDAGVSPLGTIDYYEALKAAAAADPTLPAVEDYVRFYVAPGVAHCSRGPGADEVDLLSVLNDWRDGTAPGTVIAHAQFTAAGDRPLCEWPGYPHYLGAGDPTLAANYSCLEP